MSLFKNEEILEENYKVEDLLNFKNICIEFKNKIDSLNSNSIVGLIGRFGTGKSTMLYQLYKDQKKNDDNERWVTFDAWQFPERKDLWEGFVLDITRKLDNKIFEESRKKIDGEHYNEIKDLTKILAKGANNFVPGANIVSNLANLLGSSPIKRVYQFQELMKEIINKKIKGKLYIIIEDIDRSGDRGIFFLETLKYFLKKYELENNVVVIVSIGENKFREEGAIDSYLKVLDYRYDFHPKNIDFTNFIKKAFEERRLNFYGEDITQDLNILFQKIIAEENLTIREIKHLLRNANIEFCSLTEEEKEKIDIRVFILFVAMKFLNIKKDKKQKKSYIKKTSDNKKMENGFWEKQYLLSLIISGKNYSDYTIYFKDDSKEKYVMSGVPINLFTLCFFGDEKIFISSWYLDKFNIT
jgi:hypothetical protein